MERYRILIFVLLLICVFFLGVAASGRPVFNVEHIIQWTEKVSLVDRESGCEVNYDQGKDQGYWYVLWPNGYKDPQKDYEIAVETFYWLCRSAERSVYLPYVGISE